MVDDNWLRVAGSAMALGIGLYLIPPGMITNPALIALEHAALAAVLAMLKMAGSLAFILFGIIAPRNLILRAVLIGSGLLMLFI